MPLSGDELLEVTQQNFSRRVSLNELIPGYGGLIVTSMTINVPGSLASISDAMKWLRGRTIAPGAIVTVQVDNGTYGLTEAVSLNHPQGSNIRLIGNQGDPTQCVITVADSAMHDALVCSAGHTFGFIDGFHITRPSKSEMPINTTGLLAVQNATIICGEKMRVSNWFYGIAARDGSFIYCPKAKVEHAGDVGIWAFCGSTVICNGATSDNVVAADNPWGFGFQAEFGSVLVGTGISARGCKIGGITALSNSTLRVAGAIASDNVGSGFFARDGGTIEVGAGTANSNGRYGMEVIEGRGQINGVPTATGNALGSINPFLYLTEAAGQARLACSRGPMRLDSQGETYFNSPNGLQAIIEDVAMAANRVALRAGATGAPAAVVAKGSDTNINLKLEPKGTGRIQVGATQSIPGGFANNSIIELLAADGTVIQLACKRL